MRRVVIFLTTLCAGSGTAGGHDWFSDLVSPTGVQCCTDRDCRPAGHRYNPLSRQLEIGIEGIWLGVDPAMIVATPSPDGRAYACYEYRWQDGKKMPPLVRCVILPGEV